MIGGVLGAINIDDDDMGIGSGYLYNGVFGGFIDGILEFGVLPSGWWDAFFGVGGGIIGQGDAAMGNFEFADDGNVVGNAWKTHCEVVVL